MERTPSEDASSHGSLILLDHVIFSCLLCGCFVVLSADMEEQKTYKAALIKEPNGKLSIEELQVGLLAISPSGVCLYVQLCSAGAHPQQRRRFGACGGVWPLPLRFLHAEGRVSRSLVSQVTAAPWTGSKAGNDVRLARVPGHEVVGTVAKVRESSIFSIPLWLALLRVLLVSSSATFAVCHTHTSRLAPTPSASKWATVLDGVGMAPTASNAATASMATTWGVISIV